MWRMTWHGRHHLILDALRGSSAAAGGLRLSGSLPSATALARAAAKDFACAAIFS